MVKKLLMVFVIAALASAILPGCCSQEAAEREKEGVGEVIGEALQEQEAVERAEEGLEEAHDETLDESVDTLEAELEEVEISDTLGR